MKEIQEQTNQHYEVGTQFTFNEDLTTMESARIAAVEGLGRAVNHIRLETRMFVFDALHGTNYRQIRHDLVRQQKREDFEKSIGLVSIKH